MSWVCLMYHDVTAGTPGDGGGPERFTVPLESFELMLDTIRESGYEACSLADALRGPDRPRVAITFDDGNSGQFQHAVPALRERGMTATFFVTTEWVGTPGFMSWDELRQLTEWGMSVQSHTRSHPHLSELDLPSLKAELAESKATLDAELSQETSQIALPGGNAPRPGLRHVLAETGYAVVATSRWGTNGDPGDRADRGPLWIRRCTAPRWPGPDLARRIVSGDPRLALRRSSREAALNGIRALLGASRYARWRRRFLNAVARSQG